MTMLFFCFARMKKKLHELDKHFFLLLRRAIFEPSRQFQESFRSVSAHQVGILNLTRQNEKIVDLRSCSTENFCKSRHFRPIFIPSHTLTELAMPLRSGCHKNLAIWRGRDKVKKKCDVRDEHQFLSFVGHGI